MTGRVTLGGLLVLLLFLSGCGGGSSSPAPEAVCTGVTPSGLASSTTNTMPVYESTCVGTVNTPVVTLTICQPGSTTNCEDVPNILLDYGSTGLRLSHTLPIAGELPQETVNGQGLFECYLFVSGYNFGPVVTAQITLGTTQVTVPVQISNSLLSAPSSCSSGILSAPFEPNYNGILGVLFPQYDISSAYYYEGNNGPLTPPQSDEVQNPVYLLTSNNNGVLLSISSTIFPAQGAPGFTGTLQFGAPTSGTLLQTDQNGEITATYPTSGGSSYPAFFDTGSNGFFFESTISQCQGSLPGFYCGNAPGQTATLSSSNGSTFSQTFPLLFSIYDAQTLFATGNTVFSTLGGFQAGVFDAGFPAFLYGNNIGLSWTSSCAPASSPGEGCFVIQ